MSREPHHNAHVPPLTVAYQRLMHETVQSDAIPHGGLAGDYSANSTNWRFHNPGKPLAGVPATQLSTCNEKLSPKFQLRQHALFVGLDSVHERASAPSRRFGQEGA
jgi:hypothetical protein